MDKIHRLYLEEITSPSNTYEWIPMDTKKLFNENIKKYPNDDSLNYYLKNPIEYKLNNYGFRTPDDFNYEDEGNVFLGCSYTFGIGHHLENIWSYKVNKHVGGKFWNLGIGGSGVMTHYRLLKELYKKIKIKNIFHYSKVYCRYEFFINNNPISFNAGNITTDGKIIINENPPVNMGDFLMDSLINKSQVEFMYDTHINAIKWLAHEIGCDYYLVNRCNFLGDEKSLKARDLQHNSVIQETELSEDFIKMYNQKNNL